MNSARRDAVILRGSQIEWYHFCTVAYPTSQNRAALAIAPGIGLPVAGLTTCRKNLSESFILDLTLPKVSALSIPNPMIPSNPSQEFIRINPHLFGGVAKATPEIKPTAKRTMTGPALNKTEQRWHDCNPDALPFPLRLRWGNSMHYKPDFLMRPSLLIEVKGAHVFSRDIVRFKGCAAEWDWLFRFQMWQWKNGDWTRLY